MNELARHEAPALPLIARGAARRFTGRRTDPDASHIETFAVEQNCRLVRLSPRFCASRGACACVSPGTWITGLPIVGGSARAWRTTN